MKAHRDLPYPQSSEPPPSPEQSSGTSMIYKVSMVEYSEVLVMGAYISSLFHILAKG